MNAALNMEEGHPGIAGSMEGSDAADMGDFSSEEKLSALLFMLEDLERSRKQIEQAHHEWIDAMDAIRDPIFIHDKDCRIMRCNRAYAERAGMSFKAIIGRLYYEIFPKLDGLLPHCCELMQGAEAEIRIDSGETFVSHLFPVRNKDGSYLYSLHIMDNVTERKRMQQILRESEEKFRQISATAQDGILMMDSAGRIVFWNRAAERIFGYTTEETLGKDLHALIVPERFRSAFSEKFPTFVATGTGAIVGKTLEVVATRKNGAEFPVELSVSAAQLGDQWHSIGFIRDVTERKRTEKLLIDQEERLRGVFENTSSGVVIYRVVDGGDDFEVVGFNGGAEKIERISRESVLGRRVTEVFPGVGEFGLLDVLSRVWRTGQAEHYPQKLYRDQRITGWRENHVFRLQQGDVVAVYDDITQRKQNEQALLKLNSAFRTLSACNHELVHATDELQLLQSMCRVIVEIGGYSAAWVGYKQHDAGKTVRTMAQSGFAAGYIDALQITWADSEYGQGPTGKALRSGTTQVMQDIASDPASAPWREQALKYGYVSSVALPLLNGDGVFGNLTIYAPEVNAFGQDELALLEEMTGDLAFGIRMLRLHQEQQHNARQVRMGLEGTIQAVASIVEMRDPYTAGHQRRVAQLAAAIAVELGLSDEQVRGIHLAGTIHDLGKVQTPAEILSKPGKLSAIEFSLIKDHAQNGYEILKGIEFPWPIAQMVLQHHEKLDGSGYPQGLKGDAILLEARIMTVADVVEAMSSHRPYRPGLGIDAALEEIIKERGTLYDPDVVDKCVRLIREKGFMFE